MGPYIPLYLDLMEHPKVRRLASLLGTSIPAAHSHLLGVWCKALQYARDGDLTETDAAIIASWAMWGGDPDAFVMALEECAVRRDGVGFLERTDDDRLVIHEWADHEGKVLESLEGARGRAAASRARRLAALAEAGGPLPTPRQRPRAEPKPHIRRYQERKAKEQQEAPAPPAPLTVAPAAAPEAAPPKEGKPNKVKDFLDYLTGHGIRAAVTGQDTAAIKATSLTAAEIGEAYRAIYTGDFGDQWLQERLTATAAIRAWNGMQAKRSGGPPHNDPNNPAPIVPGGNGHGPGGRPPSSYGARVAPAAVAATWQPPRPPRHPADEARRQAS